MADACKHHWRLETPNGPTSTGTCKLCGASREFQNSEDGISSLRKHMSRSRKKGQVAGGKANAQRFSIKREERWTDNAINKENKKISRQR